MDMGSIPGLGRVTCRGVAKPVCHIYWTVLQSPSCNCWAYKPELLKPMLCNKRSHPAGRSCTTAKTQHNWKINKSLKKGPSSPPNTRSSRLPPFFPPETFLQWSKGTRQYKLLRTKRTADRGVFCTQGFHTSLEGEEQSRGILISLSQFLKVFEVWRWDKRYQIESLMYPKQLDPRWPPTPEQLQSNLGISWEKRMAARDSGTGLWYNSTLKECSDEKGML